MKMPRKDVTIALLQQACGPDRSANFDHARQAATAAARAGAQIICTQELFASQYFAQSEAHENFDLAEPIPGPSTDAFGQIARAEKVVIIVSIFEQRAAGLYHNSAAVIDADGALLGIYRKMHIPDDPLYYEKFYFTPGDASDANDSGFRAWDTAHGKIGVLICWDQWFPEAARLTAMAGAEIIFSPTAIGWHPSEKAAKGEAQHNAWQLIQRSHSVANGCFVAAANRVGHEAPAGGDGLEFWGQSFVAAPSGEVLAKATIDQSETLLAEVDLAQVHEARTHWPFLRDRRIDAYGGLTERYLD
jgi:N-carbamoylputrescine amidase